MKIKGLLSCTLIASSVWITNGCIIAQDILGKEETDLSEAESERHHQIQYTVAHTHIAKGETESGDRTWLALASLCLNYNYHFNETWSVGLHSDIILEDFRVEHGEDGLVLERSRPIAVAIIGGYRFWGPFVALLGTGVEFAREENLSFFRIGIEPGWEFGDGKWEVSLSGVYEFKFEAYNSWLFGLGISRFF